MIKNIEIATLKGAAPTVQNGNVNISIQNVINGILYINVSEIVGNSFSSKTIRSSLYAYQASNGNFLWIKDRYLGNNLFVNISIIGNTFFVNNGKNIKYFDSKTGLQIWEYTFESEFKHFAQSGKIFYAVLKKGNYGTLVAFDTEQSIIKWEYSLEKTNDFSELILGVTIAQEMVFVWQGGAVVIVDKNAGKFNTSSKINAGLFEGSLTLYLKSGKTIKSGESD